MNPTVIGKAFRVTGVVQGVGFRWFARETATRAGLTGWVANDTDGSVHGKVFGDAEAVTKFLAVIERGPTLGRVVRLEATDVQPEALTTFEIRQ